MKWFKGVPEITLSITIIHLFVKIVNFVFFLIVYFFLSRLVFKMMQVARYKLSHKKGTIQLNASCAKKNSRSRCDDVLQQLISDKCKYSRPLSIVFMGQDFVNCCVDLQKIILYWHILRIEFPSNCESPVIFLRKFRENNPS